MSIYGGVRDIREDETRCVESVAEGGRSVASFQCRRNRGFGPDGLYCKQHSHEYATEYEIWYDVTYSDVQELRVTRSTDTVLWVQWGEGYKSSRRNRTGKEFRTKLEAITYLRDRCQKEFDDAKSELEKKRIREGRKRAFN